MDIRVKVVSVSCMVFLLSVAGLTAASSDLGLVDAVKQRDHEAVRSLLREQADVNASQANGATALLWAANRDDLEMVELLIRAGAKVNTANLYGITPLSMACTNGNAAMVKRLLAAGATPKTAQETGETPLMTCSRTGNAEAVRLLLAQGADVNAKEPERGQTALMWAAAGKHSGVVQALVESGADIRARSATLPLYTPKILTKSNGAPFNFYKEEVYFPKVKGGFTPLMFAAQAGDSDSVRILLEAGADVNEGTLDDGTPLVLASSNGHEKVALFLLEKGADPNATDAYGITPLHWALQEGVVALFAGTFVTDRFWVNPNMPELVKALLARGGDPNDRIKKDLLPYDVHRFSRSRGDMLPQVALTGTTPFLLAAAVTDLSAMRVLVEGGADPTMTTKEGLTPLMVAAGMGVDRGRNPTAEQQKNSLEAVRLALRLGGSVNAADFLGRTALHGAAYYGLNDVVQFLVENGADLEAKDFHGQTALSIALGDPDGFVYRNLEGYNRDDRFRRARLGSRQETVELLLKLGATPYTSTGRNMKAH